MNTKNKILKIITITVPFLLLGIIIVVRDNIDKITSNLTPCLFNGITGYYCPACGNTRSVTALLNGDFLASVKLNITPVVLSIILLLMYIEFAVNTFFTGKNIKIIPRSNIFWFVFLGAIFLYFIVRNFF